MKNKTKIFLFTAVFYFALWSMASFLSGSELLIPSPKKVFETFILIASKEDFYINVLLSALRIISGFIISLCLGTVFAVLSCRFKTFKILFYPLVSTVKATPVASFIILALLWIKTSYVPVFISFLMVMPVVWTNICQGIETADTSLLEAAEIFDMSPLKKVKYIYVPNCIPFFKSCAISGIGLAWKAGIAAEVICSPHFAIGSRLYESKIYLETPELFAWTAAVVILSIIIEKLTVKLLNTIFKDC